MTRRRGLPVAVTVISYAAAVFTLTWLTIDNRLGDQLYGHLLMLLTAFPASVPGLLIDSWLYSAVIDNDAFFTATVRDFLLLAGRRSRRLPLVPARPAPGRGPRPGPAADRMRHPVRARDHLRRMAAAPPVRLAVLPVWPRHARRPARRL
ncbi:hypothetical protein [Microtetraspora malaysiensis]|uniref:hypothetical protein n=1 Tax=Microtetraspora malaysiensis TaxID=161358 RepID=UPI003D8F894E